MLHGLACAVKFLKVKLQQSTHLSQVLRKVGSSDSDLATSITGHKQLNNLTSTCHHCQGQTSTTVPVPCYTMHVVMFHSHSQQKYGLPYYHKIHKCVRAMHTDLLNQISPKLGDKYVSYGQKFINTIT